MESSDLQILCTVKDYLSIFIIVGLIVVIVIVVIVVIEIIRIRIGASVLIGETDHAPLRLLARQMAL